VRNGTWFVRRVWDNGLLLDLSWYNRFSTFVYSMLPVSYMCNRLRNQVNARVDHALYGLQPNYEINANWPTVNDTLPSHIMSGSVQVRSGIARLTSSGVQFTDGTYVDNIDAIICATGTVPHTYTQLTIMRLAGHSVRLHRSFS